MCWSFCWFFAYFADGVICAFVTHLVAKPRGLRRTRTFLAQILGPIVVVIVVALPFANPSQRRDSDGERQPFIEWLVKFLLDLVFGAIAVGPVVFIIYLPT